MPGDENGLSSQALEVFAVFSDRGKTNRRRVGCVSPLNDEAPSLVSRQIATRPFPGTKANIGRSRRGCPSSCVGREHRDPLRHESVSDAMPTVGETFQGAYALPLVRVVQPDGLDGRSPQEASPFALDFWRPFLNTNDQCRLSLSRKHGWELGLSPAGEAGDLPGLWRCQCVSDARRRTVSTLIISRPRPVLRTRSRPHRNAITASFEWGRSVFATRQSLSRGSSISPALHH